MFKMINKWLCTSILMCVGSAAMANDYFIAVEMGNTSTKAPLVNVPEDIAENVTTSIDDSDTGWALQLGYRLNESWSATIGYADLGEGKMVFEGDTLDPDAFMQFADQAPILASGVTASVVYHVFQQDKLFVDVELGVFKWDADIDSVSEIARTSRDDSGTDIVWGANVGVQVTTHWNIIAGYKEYKLEKRVRFPYLGVNYRF